MNLVKIHKVLNADDWDQLINDLSAVNESVQLGKVNNPTDVISKEMTDLINKHDIIKDILFNNDYHSGLRGAISPFHQQPEKISERLLCQRLDAFITHAKKLKKTRCRKKDVKYSK